MSPGIGDIRKVCRFCLLREDLMSLSGPMSLMLSHQDVIHCTGIEVRDNEENAELYSVCRKCCLTIKNSVCFRRECRKNDAIFKKLVTVLSARTNRKSIDLEIQSIGSSDSSSDSEQSTITSNQYAASLDNDVDIISLNDEDSGDIASDPLHVQSIQPTTNDTTTSQAIEATLNTCASIEAMHSNHGFDNQGVHSRVNLLSCNDSVLVLRGEKMQHSPRDKLLNSNEITTIASNQLEQGSEPTPEANVGNGETCFSWPVDDDSDYSLPSIYEDEIRKAMMYDPEADRISQNPEIPERGLCPVCGGLYVDIYNHIIRSHETTNKFQCPHCSKAFKERHILKKHINTWHEKRIIFTCDQCGKGFTNHGSHVYHMVNSHLKSGVIECKICHRKFKSVDGHRKHMKEHSLTSYPCQHCEKLFKTALTLEKHNLRYHGSSS